MLKPLVSICIQTYNHKDYISQCLDSILIQQTNFPFEIILGEDESADGTRETCKEYAEKHPDKIKLFLRSRKDVIYINGNPTGRYNFMENLKACKGKYIALCEGDDYWTDPLKLQKQVDFLEKNPEYSMCFHQAEIVNNKGELIRYFNDISECKTLNTKELIQENIISTASSIFRNGLVFSEEFYKIAAADWALHLLNAERGFVYYLSDCMSSYRIHENGIWSKLSKKEQILKGVEIMKSLDRMLDYKYHNDFNELITNRLAILDKRNKPSIKKKIINRIKKILK